MSRFIAGWLRAAAEILEAEFHSAVDLLPGSAAPAAGFTLMAEMAGAWGGTFTVTVDEGAWSALLRLREAAARGEPGSGPGSELGSGPGGEPVPPDPREAWERLFGRITVAAAAELTKSSGAACEVAMISPKETPAAGMGYQLRAGEAVVALMFADRVELAVAPVANAAGRSPESAAARPVASGGIAGDTQPATDAKAADRTTAGRTASAAEIRGIDLLLGVELEASLRFGSREMALSDLLALGPGDVIQLDRALADPVDLIIGDKIVARGEVVLVNGNFGLQIAEVAEPRKSLESIRCLF